LLLDQSSAAKLGAEIPSIATVRADYAASEIYKYQVTLNNTGWRTSPVTWNSVRTALSRTEDGKASLSDIQNKIASLKPGQHIYFMNRAYIVGDLEVATYQGQRLDANTDITANSYFTLNAAYSVSKDQYDSKSAQTRYYELTMMTCR
jgi:hypothetical protein